MCLYNEDENVCMHNSAFLNLLFIFHKLISCGVHVYTVLFKRDKFRARCMVLLSTVVMTLRLGTMREGEPWIFMLDRIFWSVEKQIFFSHFR